MKINKSWKGYWFGTKEERKEYRERAFEEKYGNAYDHVERFYSPYLAGYKSILTKKEIEEKEQLKKQQHDSYMLEVEENQFKKALTESVCAGLTTCCAVVVPVLLLPAFFLYSDILARAVRSKKQPEPAGIIGSIRGLYKK